ncbi:GAF domain-containing protein (plasmid) [Streptomyces clavuligerus]|uniref:GAF domain protein n=1 Tax=Streptomyces clavuligerus TaxID=1901 RepID=D5SJ38_STRCL|nr:GAF domain-containing protein [Streptomyces clavuligerus]EFG03931.1 GAF domain protein [Streptomyces clavuligerus]MBY6307564.1 GAF domain-containing protein [Streptomyces clavuligerus]QCS09880.1 GAF domain-containing protein [Streptomyces clavuligerus]QPJ98074.1 GAF domain-containing protein [Streptomyces clavuligerus]
MTHPAAPHPNTQVQVPGGVPVLPGPPAVRAGRLAELGLDRRPRPDLDEAATALGRAADADYAMVNILTQDGQWFAGLYRAPRPHLPLIPRTMPLTDGFCPALTARGGLALVLTDVHDHPRLRSNAVVDQLGIRSYVGAPLIDPATGITLATLCFINTTALPQKTEHDQLHLIKTRRDELNPRLFHPALPATP